MLCLKIAMFKLNMRYFFEVICENCEEKRGMKIMIKYEIKPVVCDYGIFKNGELKLILNCRSNAQTIVNILNADLEKKEYAVLMKREINIEKVTTFDNRKVVE